MTGQENTGGARHRLIAGNWKMNGLRADGLALARAVAAKAAAMPAPSADAAADIVICPPATLVAAVVEAVAGTPLMVGGQDCHVSPSGAHTGDVSAEMLADAGARFVIVGHSERRQDHGETDGRVCAKLAAAHRAGLTAIVCIGETLAERDAGRTLEVLATQLDGSLGLGALASAHGPVTAETTLVAYEPVWAIGTGRTPTIEQVAEAHGHIRAHLRASLGAIADALRLLYGGSVKPANAAALMAVADVDGALVGGASLDADDFWAIVGETVSTSR